MLTTYCPYDNDYYIFLANNGHKIKDMAILIHEFGHVLDFATYRQGHLVRNIGMYQATSVYTKVNSTYYEYSFYEYLIKNNIYKEEALLNLSNSLASYMDLLAGISFLENVPDFMLHEDKEIIKVSEIPNINEEKISFMRSAILEMKDSMEYGYGIMLAFAMLDNPSLYDSFQRIKELFVTKEKKDKARFTNKLIAKTMTKKINKYFKI